jgi:hypothetical protein
MTKISRSTSNKSEKIEIQVRTNETNPKEATQKRRQAAEHVPNLLNLKENQHKNEGKQQSTFRICSI